MCEQVIRFPRAAARMREVNMGDQEVSIPRTPSFRLDGRRALVTGGSRGIGLGAAAALAEAGAHVLVAARDEQRVSRVVAALAEMGRSVEGASLDVTDQRAVTDLIETVEPFDILVNSAGIARHREALHASAEDYDQVMDVNVRAAFFLAREVARRMLDRGGSIIQVSSQMGLVGGIERAVYCASKHAIEGMTKAMAMEWASHGIRVNTVCPTFIRTDFTTQTLEDPVQLNRILTKIKLGRVGEVEDVMGAVVFLASDASSLVTGAHLVVDGGWTAG